MSGINSNSKPSNITPTKRKFKITFSNTGKTIEVDPAKYPYSGTGREGSILDIALGNNVKIEHVCGGVCACATCHIYVKKGMSSCSEIQENESDMLDHAVDLTPESRLSCQCVPNGNEDITVEIPNWNRNLVSEGS